MFEFQLAMAWRGLAYGFLASGAIKFLYLFFASGGLTPVQVQYRIITCVTFLGAGGTILIRKSE